MKTFISNINDKWYAFEADQDRVFSIGKDCPHSGIWTARLNAPGVLYVASPSPTRQAAYQKARRHGTYCGELYL